MWNRADSLLRDTQRAAGQRTVMTMQAIEIESDIDESSWQARVAVVWRDEQLPVPIGDDSRSVAASAGVRLSTRPGSCVAHFVVSGASLGEAIPRALSVWTEIVETASLPKWEIVSFSLDQLDEGDLPFA